MQNVPVVVMGNMTKSPAAIAMNQLVGFLFTDMPDMETTSDLLKNFLGLPTGSMFWQFWSLDFGTRFGPYIRTLLSTPTRVGGFISGTRGNVTISGNYFRFVKVIRLSTVQSFTRKHSRHLLL